MIFKTDFIYFFAISLLLFSPLNYAKHHNQADLINEEAEINFKKTGASAE